MNSPTRKRTPSLPSPLILRPKINKTYLSPKPCESPPPYASSPCSSPKYIPFHSNVNISTNNSQPNLPSVDMTINSIVQSSSAIRHSPSSSFPNRLTSSTIPQHLRRLPDYSSYNFKRVFDLKVDFCKKLFSPSESTMISQKAAIFQEFVFLFTTKIDISQIPLGNMVEFFEMLKINIFRLSPHVSVSSYERDDFILPQIYDIFCLPLCYQLMDLLQESMTHSIFFDQSFFKQVLFHFDHCDPSERFQITKLAITYVRKNEDQIPQLFKLLQSKLINFNDGLLTPMCVSPLLAVIYLIFQKTPTILTKTFITTVLLPLLRSPCYSLFRKEFVGLIDDIVTIPQFHVLLLYVVSSYLKYWPKTNDRKTIDFIIDASKLFTMLGTSHAKRFSRALFLTLAKCVVSVHSKVSEAAVSTLLSQDLQSFMKDAQKIVFPTLLKIILPANDPQLNMEGIKMILNSLRATNASYYKSVCQSLNKNHINYYPNIVPPDENREKWKGLIDMMTQKGYFEFQNIIIT